MSTTRLIPRLGVAIGTLLAMLWVASPAFAADDIDVSISGLSSSLSAGARGVDTFRANLQNKTDNEIQPVRKVVTVRLAGLKPDQVRFFRGAAQLSGAAGGAGEVRAADPLQIRLGPDGKALDSNRTDYGIQFAAGAPNGKAEVTFQAFRGDQLLGSDSKNVTVKGGVAQPSSSASHSPTPSVTQSSPAAAVSEGAGNGGGVVAAPGNPAQANVADTASVPVIFYVLGAILVGVGGVILWMLFRPRPALVAGADGPGGSAGGFAGGPTGPYQPAGPYQTVPAPLEDRAPTLGYPKLNPPAGAARHAANTHPTTVMPPVPDSPPPPVDPWATQGGGTSGDVTRGFGPPRS